MPECVQYANAGLGESPVWSAEEDALYWIDINRPAIYRLNREGVQTGNWPMPSAVGAIGLHGSGGLIVATEQEGISLLETTTGTLSHLARPVFDEPGRFNDGRVDARGRFWVGWLTHARISPGALLRIEPSGECVVVLDNLVAPNGLGWSPDATTMYVTDSHVGTIWAYEFDVDSGKLGTRRRFFEHPRSEGVVDGLCVDAEGFVWTALYNGWALLRLDSVGAIVATRSMPIALPTSCCFGGSNLEILYVTSAIRSQSGADLVSQPAAGGIFAIVGAGHGRAEHRFGLIGA